MHMIDEHILRDQVPGLDPDYPRPVLCVQAAHHSPQLLVRSLRHRIGYILSIEDIAA